MKLIKKSLSVILVLMILTGMLNILSVGAGAASNNTSEQWKNKYIEYINGLNNNSLVKYCLLDLDGNGIPELFFDSGTVMGGGTLSAFSQGNINTVNLGSGGVSFWGLSYWYNRLYCSWGRQGMYYKTIFEVSNSTIKCLFDGKYIAKSETDFDINNPNDFTYSYRSDTSDVYKTVSYNEFNSTLADLFDTNQASKIFYQYDASNIISAINDYCTITDWKQLYTDFINKNYLTHSKYATPEYSLAQINNDNTPELILRATNGASYVDQLYLLIWVLDGQLTVEKQSVEKYTQKANKFYSIGRGTATSHTIDGGKIQTIHTATWYGEYIAVDGERVDKEAYQKCADEIYQYGNQSPEYKSKEQIIKDINQYNSINYDLLTKSVDFEKFRAKYYSENTAFISDAYMTYKEIEDNYSPTAHTINLALSLGWEASFNFSDSSQIWETILLDIILRNGSSEESIGESEKAMYEICSNFKSFIEESDIADVKLPIQSGSKEVLKNLFKETADALTIDTSDIFDKMDVAMDAADTLMDFVDNYSKYLSINNFLNNNIKSFLAEMKNTTEYKDIPAFKTAIDRIVSNFKVDSEKLFSDVFGQTVFQHAYTKCLNELVGVVVKSLLGPKIFALAEFTKAGTIFLMDAIMGTGSIAKNNIYVYMVDRIDDAASSAFNRVAQLCAGSNGEKYYQQVLGGYAFFESLYSYGIDLCLKWTDEITTNIISKMIGDDYTHVNKPYYDIANDYLNLNHSSSKQEKRQYVYQKIKNDEKWVDQCLHNLPTFAFLDWQSKTLGSQSNNQCIVLYHVENPSGGHTLYANVVDKGSTFKAPDLPTKNGYSKPSFWYSDKSYTQRVFNSSTIQQNICYYSKYSPSINYQKTDDNTGITILKISGSKTSSDSVGAYVDSEISSGFKYIIPSFIEGYAVKELGEDIFENYSEISELSLPSSIIKINKNAFNSLSSSTKYIAVNGSIAEQFIKDHNFANILISGKVGDTNLDGAVDISDATTVQMFIAEMIGYDSDQEKASDTNGDTKIDISDATTIQMFIAEMIDHLGNQESISLSSSEVSMFIGDKTVLSATVKPDSIANKSVTWNSSDESVVTVSNGVVTANSPGTAIITAKTYNGKTATCKVTVKERDVISISLNQSLISLYVGNTYQLYATINPSNATNKSITWETSKPSVASIDSNGVIKANAVGNAVITAKSSNGKTATCKITVSPILPESVKISDEIKEVDVNDSFTLSATVSPNNTTDKTLTWSTSDASIATVTQSGEVKAIHNGVVTITASATNGVKATCEVWVYTPISGSISLMSFLSREPNGYLRLTKDISIEAIPACKNVFGGCINGDNHTITFSCKNTTEKASSDVNMALIEKTDGAVIKNIKTAGTIEHDMHSVNMCGNCCAGLVANAQNTLFENCENTANIDGIFWGSDSAYAITGGIAALSNNCIFKDCSNSGQIESFAYSNKESVSVAGGISGQANNSIFYSCYNNSTIFPRAILDECDNPNLCSACSGGISGIVENSDFISCIGNGKYGALIWPKNTTQLESFAASGGIAGAGNAAFYSCTSTAELLPRVNISGKSYKDDLLALTIENNN